MTHPIPTEHPRWTEHQREIDKLEAARRTWIDRATAETAERQKAMKDHQAAVKKAMRMGTDPPPEPDPPQEGPTTSWFVAEHQELMAAGKKLLEEIAPEIEVAAEGRQTELETEARALIDQLRPIAAELSALGDVVAKTRMQVHVAEGITPATRPRTRTEVSVVELVELIQTDQRPLDPWT